MRVHPRTTLLSLLVCAAVALPLGSGAAAASQPPAGTTWWRNSADSVGVRLSGNKVRVANPLSPCFTGVRVAPDTYKGGGGNQQGGYTWATWRVSVSGNQLTLRHDGYTGRYYRSTKASVSRQWNGVNPKRWFSDCGLG